jgi:hypothetical protein
MTFTTVRKEHTMKGQLRLVVSLAVVVSGNLLLGTALLGTAAAATYPSTYSPYYVDCGRGSAIGNFIHVGPPRNVYAYNRTAAEDIEAVYWRASLQIWNASSRTWVTTAATGDWRHGVASDTRGLLYWDTFDWEGFPSLPTYLNGVRVYYRAAYQIWWSSTSTNATYVAPQGIYYWEDSLGRTTLLSTGYCSF